MKYLNFLLQFTVLSILFYKCHEDNFQNKISLKEEKILSDSLINIYACNDLASIRSEIDLKILSYISTCYLCSSLKSVPGFGSINWTSNCETYFTQDSFLKIEIRTYQKDNLQFYPREKILFLNVPKKIGVFKLSSISKINNQKVPYASYFRLVADGDLLDASWKIDTSCTNYLNINQINLDDKYISGEFEIHLMIDNKSSITNYSDRINFTESKFQSNISFL